MTQKRFCISIDEYRINLHDTNKFQVIDTALDQIRLMLIDALDNPTGAEEWSFNVKTKVEYAPAYSISTMHHCPANPWSQYNRCVYDNQIDPAHDNCMFCGEPEERK